MQCDVRFGVSFMHKNQDVKYTFTPQVLYIKRTYTRKNKEQKTIKKERIVE